MDIRNKSVLVAAYLPKIMMLLKDLMKNEWLLYPLYIDFIFVNNIKMILDIIYRIETGLKQIPLHKK